MNRRRRRARPGRSDAHRRSYAAVAALTLAASLSAGAGSLSGSAFQARSQGAGGDWPTYHGDLAGSRYSRLDQIHRGNVGDLEIVWQWRSDNFGPRPEVRSITTPLMVDGRMYFTAGSRRAVVAVDPGTGETLWTWRMDEGRRGAPGVAPRPNSGRGVATWSDGLHRRVFVVTPGYQLVALDAATGYPVRTFGDDGRIDLMVGARGLDDPVGTIGNSSPPLVVDDVVVVGAAHHVGFRPPSMRNTKGDVRAFDARSGAPRWTFRTIPEAGDPGAESWLEGSAGYTGNAGVWAPMSADPELGLIYLPVEAPTGDYYGGHRPGDNLFGNSVVALDAATGERRWHFQVIHHDVWDWDNPTAPLLADVTVDGRPRRVLVQLTKQAFAYVLDRVTGDPIWPIEELPVPQSDVPGEHTSPTQPIPSRPAPFDRQGFAEDDLIDLTPELRAAAREAVAPFRMGPLFTPASLAQAPDGSRGTLSMPMSLGGANWEHGALDPVSGVLYVGSSTWPAVLALAHEPDESDMRYIFRSIPAPSVMGLPLVKPPWGRITAIDLHTGEHVWMRPNGRPLPQHVTIAERLGIELGETGKPLRAGLLATATLLFAGEGWGVVGGAGAPLLRALDKRTGETIAEIALPGTQTGLPMTYLHQGRQYVTLAVSSAGDAARIVALALPAESQGD